MLEIAQSDQAVAVDGTWPEEFTIFQDSVWHLMHEATFLMRAVLPGDRDVVKNPVAKAWRRQFDIKAVRIDERRVEVNRTAALFAFESPLNVLLVYIHDYFVNENGDLLNVRHC